MAEILGLGINIDIGGIVTVVFNSLMFSAIGAVVGAVAIWIMLQMSFKHVIIVKILTNKRTIIFRDNFKIVRDKDGTRWYKLKRRKDKIPVAPPEAIDITAGGKLYVEAYYTEDGEYVYSKEKESIGEEIRNKGAFIVDEKETKKGIIATFKKRAPHYVYISDDNYTVKTRDPFTTSQRALLVDQLDKAKAEGGFSWKQNLPFIAGLGMVLIVLIMVFVFWEDITKPSLEFAKTNQEISKENKETAQAIRDTVLKIQSVAGSDGTSQQPRDAPD